MFVSSVDEAAGAVVGVYHGHVNEDVDYARCVSSIIESDAAASSRGCVHACILVLQADTPLPPPIWRKRMADANKQLRSSQHYFAIVCPNPLHRGVLTAILWLTGQRGGHQYAAFSTFSDAASWVQGQTATSVQVMKALYERAEAKLQR